MIDRFIHQHQRMLDSGVNVSRANLINWIQKGIELLRHIYHAMPRQMLQSSVLAMDDKFVWNEI